MGTASWVTRGVTGPPVLSPERRPQPPATARRALPIADLKPGDPPGTVMKAYAATVRVLQGYAAELEQLLERYRAAPTRHCPSSEAPRSSAPPCSSASS